MSLSYIGVFGLGVMGQSIALNISNHNYSISVFNIESSITDNFIKRATIQNITQTYSIKEFIKSLERPRKILLMITAGDAVDSVLNQLLPFLEKGDIVIDGGNSYFKDTIKREEILKKSGIYFLGVGISGGEKGALEGPSIMPSGDLEAYKIVKDVLSDISAKTDDGKPCCTYIGPNGAGHFVKTVHNGIEYADIQLICDIYQIMRNVLNMDYCEMSEVFKKWNSGRLNSYLIDITSKILNFRDEITGEFILDVILDKAGQKGTGKWASIEALDLAVPIPSITESVFLRFMSDLKSERIEASKILNQNFSKKVIDKEKCLEEMEKALYSAKICVYAQGYQLMQIASETYNWNLNLGDISLIWRSGCIIQALFLNDIKESYDSEKEIKNLILSKKFSKLLLESEEGLRKICILAIENGVSSSGLLSTLSYLDSYRTSDSSANLLQAQRDFFGAHTYERKDREGLFHTNWEKV